MQPDTVDLYAILGVSPDASQDQLKSAFRRACKRCHPDAGGTEQQMMELLAAYEVLSDPVLRANYDEWRGQHAAGSTSESSNPEAAATAGQSPFAEAKRRAEQVYRVHGQSWAELSRWIHARSEVVRSTSVGRLASGGVAGLALGTIAGAIAGTYLGIGWIAGCTIGSICGLLGGALAADANGSAAGPAA